MAVPMAATRMCSSSGRKLQADGRAKRTLATVNALLGNVFLTSDMPSHYTDAQRDEYRRLRRLFEHAKQVEVETENGVITIRYSLDEKRQELRCGAIYRE